MHNDYKSPFKSSKFTLTSPSVSPTPRIASKKTFPSQSKYASSGDLNGMLNQAYTNVLNRLLRINDLPNFIKQANRYVELTEEQIDSFKINDKQTRKSRKEFPDIGRTLLIDGGFIKHYCKLMEHYFPDQAKQIRKKFYEKYKDEVLHRKKMFDIYFKVEMQALIAQSMALQASRSKRKDASQRKARARSEKKAASECQYKEREDDKNIETHSAIDYHSESECTVASEQNMHKYDKMQHFNEASLPVPSAVKKRIQEEKEEQIETFSPQRYFNPKESEEDRNKRFEGIIKQTSLSTISKRKTVKFAQQMKSNKKLGELYDQVKKERKEFEQIKKNIDKKYEVVDDEKTTIVRSSLKARLTMAEQMRLKKISDIDINNLSEIEQEMIKKYPKITKKGCKNSVAVDSELILGTYRGYVFKKVLATDIYHYLEPMYQALLVTKSDSDQTQSFEFSDEDNFEVILID